MIMLNKRTEKTCIICGKKFMGTYQAKYCSIKCRKRGRNKYMAEYKKTHPHYQKKADERKKKIGYHKTEKYRETHRKTARKYRAKNKEKTRKYNREYRKKQKEKAAALLGNTCFICKTFRALRYHKKDGEEHKISYSLVIKNPQDFVRLCEFCHKAIHWLMKWFDMTWEEIVEKVISLNKLEIVEEEHNRSALG